MIVDLTSRSALIALMYQSAHSAEESHREHVAIVDAFERRDAARGGPAQHHAPRARRAQRAARSAQPRPGGDPGAAGGGGAPGPAPDPPAVSNTMSSPDRHPLRYPRDLAGHGRTPPQAQWPGQARVALQFVLNYEEGGENSVLHGDAGSEQFLSEMFNPPAYRRAPPEHGEHLRIRLARRRLAHPARVRAPRPAADDLRRRHGARSAAPRWPRPSSKVGHEIACHGWRWISYQQVDEADRARPCAARRWHRCAR